MAYGPLSQHALYLVEHVAGALPAAVIVHGEAEIGCLANNGQRELRVREGKAIPRRHGHHRFVWDIGGKVEPWPNKGSTGRAKPW